LIAEEIPLNITLESNQRSEAKAALLKKTLEQTEMNLVQIIQETEQTAEGACRGNNEYKNVWPLGDHDYSALSTMNHFVPHP